MSRTVKGVWKAKELAGKPNCIPVSRPRGAKGAGIRYEKAFGKALGAEARRGVWFEYQDVSGGHYCQVDFLLHLPDFVVVLECKYSWTREAFVQIENLYVPVLRVAYQKPVFGLQVCKRLLPAALENGCKVVGVLGNGLILAGGGARVALHWLEGTPVRLMPTESQVREIKTRAEKERIDEQVD